MTSLRTARFRTARFRTAGILPASFSSFSASFRTAGILPASFSSFSAAFRTAGILPASFSFSVFTRVLLCVLCVLCVEMSFAQKSKPAGLFDTEKSKFRVLLAGQRVGEEEFEFSQDGAQWRARGSVKITAAGATAGVTSNLLLDAAANPVRYEWTLDGEKKATGTVIFKDGTATLELLIPGVAPYTQEFTFPTPRIVVLDNNLYHHYAVLARVYDWTARGSQTFNVLIPQDPTPGTVTVESLGPQSVGSAKYEVLRVRSADLEIDLYTDNRKLIRIAVPAANAIIERE